MEDTAGSDSSGSAVGPLVDDPDDQPWSAQLLGKWGGRDHVGAVLRRPGRAGWAIVGLLVVAAGLRLYRLGEESVWLDEAFTWYFVSEKYTTVELLLVAPTEDVHPPLYYVLMDLWVSVAGVSESALRFPSAVFGVASVGLLYLLGVKLFDRTTGWIAAALLALSTFHLYYAQEARMYTLLTTLTLVSFYFFVDLLDGAEHGRLSIAGYVVATALLAYTHVFGAFVVLAQNTYLFGRAVLPGRSWSAVGRRGSASTSLRGWLGIQAMLAVLVAPWWGTLLYRLPSISAGGCTTITWIPEPTPAGIWMMVRRYFYYCGTPARVSPIPSEVFLFVIVLAVALAVIGLLGALERRSGSDHRWSAEYLVVVWLLTPIVVPYVLSHTVTPIMVTRYTIGASLALFLLVGRGVQTLRSSVPTAVRVALVGVLLLGLVAPFPGYYEADQKRQWREAVGSIESSDDPGDLVLVTKSHLVPAYQYYARRPPDTVVGMGRLATRETVREAIGDRESVWVVRSWIGQTTLGGHLRSLNYTAAETVRSQGITARHFVREPQTVADEHTQSSRQSYSLLKRLRSAEIAISTSLSVVPAGTTNCCQPALVSPTSTVRIR